MADEKKGITVKIDADLHAEIREYLERHEGMTMAEFITLAVDDELHPKIQQKEGNNMGNMRTMAFQVPEELFQRIKDYLHRNNMSQKEFVLGLLKLSPTENRPSVRAKLRAKAPKRIPARKQTRKPQKTALQANVRATATAPMTKQIRKPRTRTNPKASV